MMETYNSNHVKKLFDSSNNDAFAVLDTVAKYLSISTNFFEKEDWKTALHVIFAKYAVPNATISNISRNSVNSIPATPVNESKRDRPLTKSFKPNIRSMVLATSPEPNPIPQRFHNVEEDDDYHIPETQQIPETQPMRESNIPDIDEENSNDSFLQVEPDIFNSWLPDTQTQILDSASNSPDLKYSNPIEVQPPLRIAFDDGDDTDCEEELSILVNQTTKQTDPFEGTANATDCASTTPDLIFDVEPPKQGLPVDSIVTPGNLLDHDDADEIPVSQNQVKRQPNAVIEAHDESNDLFDGMELSTSTYRTPPRHSSTVIGNPSLDDDDDAFFQPTQAFVPTSNPADVPTQKFIANDNPHDPFDEPTQKFIDFDDAAFLVPTQAIVPTSNPTKDYPLDPAEEPTQKFIGVDDIVFSEPTQAIVPTPNPADVPTQKFISNDNPQNPANVPTQKFIDDDHAFLLPTQAIIHTPNPADVPTQKFISNNNQNPADVSTQKFVPIDDEDDDDSFLQPTQKLISRYELNEDDDNDAFNQSTQKIISRPNPADVPTQAFVDDVFEQDTQKMVPGKNKLKPNPVVCIQRCKKLDDETKKYASKKYNNDDNDVYDMATQQMLSDTKPQTSVNYSAGASVLNATSPSSKTKRNAGASGSKMQPLDSSSDSETEDTPKTKTAKIRLLRRRLSSPEQEFNTPNYDFIKMADPQKIRASDSMFSEMSRKAAKIRFLFNESTDEEEEKHEANVAVPKTRSKFVPKVPSTKSNLSLMTSKPVAPIDSNRAAREKERRKSISNNVATKTVSTVEPLKTSNHKDMPRKSGTVEPLNEINPYDVVRKSSRNQKPTYKRRESIELSTMKRKSATQDELVSSDADMQQKVVLTKKKKTVTQVELVSSGNEIKPMVSQDQVKGQPAKQTNSVSQDKLVFSDTDIVTSEVRRNRRKSTYHPSKSETKIDSTALSSSTGTSKTESQIRTRRHSKPEILFTIVDPKPHANTIAMIGGRLVDSPDKCNILVTSKVFRTYKFLSAMGRGTSIVSENWIIECAKQKCYIDPEAYILQDPMSEKRYKFSLIDSLKAARKKKILENYSIFITPNTKPLPQELMSIITCAGGRSLLSPTQSPRKGDTVVAVSCADDRAIWPKLRERHPDLLIFNTEGLMLSVMQHRINFKPYKLK